MGSVRGGELVLTAAAASEMKPRILLVEDEPGLVLTLSDRLETDGYRVQACGDGQAAVELILREAFDLILLDVMLPRKNGFDVLREIRQEGIESPVILLTARGELMDKVTGFKAGADDYLTKPFEQMELLLRIEALLRRTLSAGRGSDIRLRVANLDIDSGAGTVRVDGRPVDLSATEFRLLRYLAERAGTVVTRDQLLTDVWGYEVLPQTRTVDVHMNWLRQKIERDPKRPELLLTVRGSGYKLVP